MNKNHPISTVKRFKSFLFKSSLGKIFFVFFIIYLFVAAVYTAFYLTILHGQADIFSIAEYALYTSFGFDSDAPIKSNTFFDAVNFTHQLVSLLLSTIFTAAIVLKFFFLPTFFIFKRKCNYDKEHNRLIISFYNATDIFITSCSIKVYARKNILDKDGVKTLININQGMPIFEKIFPFMEPFLVSRILMELDTNKKEILDLLEGKSENSIELIMIIEAKASNLDSDIYEIKKYLLDPKKLHKSVTFAKPHSIDLDFNDFKNSKGWENFED